MPWRVAESLETLRKQLNEAFPKRSKASDGGIGDAKHASRSSDHNPYIKHKGVGIVTARDFTHDPKTGIDCQWLADTLVKNKDPRIKYIIWNHQICSSLNSPWKWRPYSGVNAHTKHLHLSVDSSPTKFDSTKAWKLDFPKARTGDVAKVAEPEQAINAGEALTVPVPFAEDLTSTVNQPSQPSPTSAELTEAPTSETNITVENVEAVVNETAKPAPTGDAVTVADQKVSLWAKIMAAFAFITGAGINLWNIIETKINEMTPAQFGYALAGLAVIGVAIYLYDKAGRRAHERTLALVKAAEDTSKNTVVIK